MPETIETATGRRRRKRAERRPPRPRWRWARRTAVVLAGVLVMVLAAYGWAWSSLDSSAVARALVWFEADVGDQFRFPSRVIETGEETSPLPIGTEIDLPRVRGGDGAPVGFDRFLRENDTLGFALVHKDRLVYERYFAGSDRHTLQTSFSVAKPFVSTLVGMAIEEGLIGSVNDPVTDYLPELAQRDRRFERITLRHLLTMSSGIRYWDSDLPWPWADDTYTYYGTDLREAALSRTRIEGPPAKEWHYNNYHPLLLGMVLERVTGMSVSEYMSTRLWRPLGAEADATWNLDSERSGFEKMESGLNATVVDYARFGLLYLHEGEWYETRVLSEDWMHAATASDSKTNPANFYQYFWWVDVERPDRFYALGNLGQYIYVAPDADAVIVRNGSDWGVENNNWLSTFRQIADRLALPSSNA